MQQNYMNSIQQPYIYPQANPNAVNINIIAPQAYGASACAANPVTNSGFYSLYGQNTNPNLPLYPQNYNNLALQQNAYGYPNGGVQNPIQQPALVPQTPVLAPNVYQGFHPNLEAPNQGQGLNNMSSSDMTNNSNLIKKTENIESKEVVESQDTKNKTKKIVPLTDDYIKSIENYMNNENPKIRLIGAKEMLERFKEDENRKDNPSLMPLLNKALRDTSAAVRFLALTILQLGYAAGNDETVTILKEIQAQNKDRIGEDQLLASEILLSMAGGQKVDSPMTENEILKAQQKEKTKGADSK